MNSDYNEFENTTVQLLDEGHNLEDYIRNVSAFEVTNKSLYHVRYVDGVDTVNDGKFERVEKQIKNKHDALEWLDALLELVTLRLIDSDNARLAGNINVKKRIMKLTNMQQRIKMVTHRMHKNPDNWVYTTVDKGFKLVPLYIGDYADEVIFRHADIHIFSSATLPAKKVLCKRFGFSEDDVFYYTMPSPFDSDKAPIFSYPQPTMTYSPDMTIKRSKMGGVILSIMREYQSQKGLILCNSFKEVEFYEEYISKKDTENAKRLTVHRRGDNAETLMEEHIEKDGSVIISPSLWEGLSLDGPLGEFLCIAKVPYADINSPVIKGLMELDKGRYFQDAVLKIQQGVGRVIRSVDDRADVYILDGGFRKMFRYNKNLFTDNFKSRLIYL